MGQHRDELSRVWPTRFVRQHGPLRPVVERVLRAFLKCGLLEHGFGQLMRLFRERLFNRAVIYRSRMNPSLGRNSATTSPIPEKELPRHLVDEIQEVYRLQGVNINDKHIEVISLQMMRAVKVEEVGDSEPLIDEVVDRFRFMSESARLLGRELPGDDARAHRGGDQRQGRPPRALKESVIMGRLIPAGTGMAQKASRASPRVPGRARAV